MVTRTFIIITAVIAALAGCGSFEDPTLVLDLRVLAMHASPPEQVVDVDLEAPDRLAILSQLAPTTVCGLVADPNAFRPLRWSMTLCLLDAEARCDRERPYVELGAGQIDDPDTSEVAQTPCAQVFPSNEMIAMLLDAVDQNPVEALGGVQTTVVLSVAALDDPTTEVFASKHLRVSPRIPAGRLPNVNPTVNGIDSADANNATVILPRNKRCAELDPEDITIPTVRPGGRITLFPNEPPDVRETYLAPTLDGGIAQLKETISYQWLATRGAWSDEFTGGGHDVLGNQSLLGSDWIAPEVTGTTLVSLWMIQREERFGVSWYETCVRIMRP